jgi:hypothetical protein
MRDVRNNDASVWVTDFVPAVGAEWDIVRQVRGTGGLILIDGQGTMILATGWAEGTDGSSPNTFADVAPTITHMLQHALETESTAPVGNHKLDTSKQQNSRALP